MAILALSRNLVTRQSRGGGATQGQHRHQTSATHLHRAHRACSDYGYLVAAEDGQQEKKQVYDLSIVDRLFLQSMRTQHSQFSMPT